MIDTENDMKLDELDRLLNDPDSKMEPGRVWTLLAEIAQQQQGKSTPETVPPL